MLEASACEEWLESHRGRPPTGESVLGEGGALLCGALRAPAAARSRQRSKAALEREEDHRSENPIEENP